MRKFIQKVLIFLSIILVVDVGIGYMLGYLARNPKGGDNARNNYICDSTHEDILIFGSSRALHHYNPMVFEDTLQMSCYNCGQDGNGVILNYGRLRLITKRYQPTIIICDIAPDYDLHECDNNQFLGWLRGSYDRDSIAEIFKSVDNNERIKMCSQLYRHNSRFIQVLGDYIHPMQRDAHQGFRPLMGELDTMKLRDEKEISKVMEVDSLKVFYLNQMISLCHHSKLFFVISPIWYRQEPSTLEPIRDICRLNDIPLLDFSVSPKYVHHNEFFKDGSHLNERGAEEFSKDVAREIRVFMANRRGL